MPNHAAAHLVVSNHAAPSRGAAHHAAPNLVAPSYAVSNRVVLSHAGLNQAVSNRAGLDRAVPNRAVPSHVAPNWVVSNQVARTVAGHRMAVHHAQAWAHREAPPQLGEGRRVVRNHQGADFPAPDRLDQPAHRRGARCSAPRVRSARSHAGQTAQSPADRRPAQVLPWARHQSDQSHLAQSQSVRGRWMDGRRVARWRPPGRSRAYPLPLVPAGHRTVPARLTGWTRRTVPAARSASHLAGPGQPARPGDEPWQGECPQAGQSGAADPLPDQPVACPQAGSLASRKCRAVQQAGPTTGGSTVPAANPAVDQTANQENRAANQANPAANQATNPANVMNQANWANQTS